MAVLDIDEIETLDDYQFTVQRIILAHYKLNCNFIIQICILKNDIFRPNVARNLLWKMYSVLSLHCQSYNGNKHAMCYFPPASWACKIETLQFKFWMFTLFNKSLGLSPHALVKMHVYKWNSYSYQSFRVIWDNVVAICLSGINNAEASALSISLTG